MPTDTDTGQDATTGATPGTNPTGNPDPKVDTGNIPEVVANEEARKQAVRGVNPATGAAAYLVENISDDENLAALALALRTAPVGTFHSVAADLRTVEASATAAKELQDAFNKSGLRIVVMSKNEFKDYNEEQDRAEQRARGVDTSEEDKRRSKQESSEGDTPSATSTRSASSASSKSSSSS